MKKLVASLFGVAILAGLTLSFSNFKSVKSLILKNVDAITYTEFYGYYSWWNGIPLEGNVGNGSCGLVYIDPDSGMYRYYCWISSSYKDQLYENYNGQAWCCEHCSQTTYCGDVLPAH